MEHRTLSRRLFHYVLAGLTTFGTGTAFGTLGTTAQSPLETSADHAVFQLTIVGGYGSTLPPTPKLTIWESGRVLFWDNDLLYREGRVPPEDLSRLEELLRSVRVGEMPLRTEV